jgi:hypothetical protein
MQVRAEKSVKLGSHERVTSCDASMPGLHTQQGFTSSNVELVQNLCDGSVFSTSHGKCWFYTDSEASDCSGMEVPVHANCCGDDPAHADRNPDLIQSHTGNFSKSPPCTQKFTARDQGISSNIGFPLSDNPIQHYGGVSSLQHSDHNDMLNSRNTHSFSREAFAPNVMPWFKARRKSANK